MTILEKKLTQVVAKGRFTSKSDAMIQAGYSPATAKHPTAKVKIWPKLLEKYLPDDKLLAKHSEALEATKWNDFTGEREEDHATRLKAVDMGYKVKSKYVENNPSINIQGEKVLVIPSEIIEKYETSRNTGDSSQR